MLQLPPISPIKIVDATTEEMKLVRRDIPQATVLNMANIGKMVV